MVLSLDRFAKASTILTAAMFRICILNQMYRYTMLNMHLEEVKLASESNVHNFFHLIIVI